MMNSTTDVVQFKPSAYDAPEAVNLRQVLAVEHSKRMKALLAFTREGSSLWEVAAVNGMMFGSAAGLLSVFSAFGFGTVEQNLLVAIPAGLFASAGISILFAPLFVRPVRKDQHQANALADSAARAANEELQQWLRENYGLKGTVEANLDLLEANSPDIPISLSTLDGVRLSVEAELKPVADGTYELRKTAVKRADESVYFDRVDSAHQLTANRSPAAALTAGR